jgi:NAD(P)-dependent dehydrogenase (short-subunit alcohol dehydrogenase family)
MTENSSSYRVGLVTGASKGIGRLCAERLAAANWRVFGGARTKASLDGVEMIQMDVNDDASVKQAITYVLGQAGKIDAVINNAGFSIRGSVEDVSMDEAKAIFETNFFGALRVCQAATPALRNSRGCIINMSSLAGVVGVPFTAHYYASKAALEALSESLRIELRPFGIRVVLVEPGDYRTDLQKARRISEATKTGVYARAFDVFLQKRRAFELRASTAEPVAILVQKILDDPDPKLRYVVAMPSQRILPILKRFLPQNTFEWAMMKILSG